MAIKQISIDNDYTTVKEYICLPVDEVSTYPTDCGIGSSMTVYNETSGKSIAFLEFDGIQWQYTNVTIDLNDLTNYTELQVVSDSSTVNFNDKVYKNATVTYDYDQNQVETATVVAEAGITLAGDATVILTASGVTGSPITFTVPVALADTASGVAEKIVAVINESTAVTAKYLVVSDDADIVLTRLIPTANDTSLNLAIANDTCEGITDGATSTNTTVGGSKGKEIIFSNVPTRAELKLEVIANGNPTLDFGEGITWSGDTPTIVAGTVRYFGFRTFNGGTTWFANVIV